MKFVVATLGSKGDLHPFLAVARALREQGRDVLFLSQEPHRAEVEAQAVPFEAIASARDHERTMSHPGLWHPIRGFGVLWRHLVVPAIDPTVAILDRLRRAMPARQLRVFASPLVVGARLAVDLCEFRLITGHTAPAALRSCHDPMFLGSWQVPRWVPRPLREGLWRMLDRQKLEPMAAPQLNAWRAARGMPALTGPVFGAWLHSPHRVIGMFPPDFGPMPSDWPAPVEAAGFPLYEPSPIAPITAQSHDVNLFCQDNSGKGLLLVFYPGSVATGQGQSMIRAAEHFAAEGYRTLFIGPSRPESKALPKTFMTVDWVHLPSVLGKAAAFVHHGGIGALAQGVAAGVRQIILPSAYDQFDNAWRLDSMHHLHGLTSFHGGLHKRMIEALRHAPPAKRGMHSVPGAPNAAVNTIISRLTA